MTAAANPERAPEDRMLEVMGLRLATRWLCPGPERRGPTVVLLHEALGSIGQWKAFPQQLAVACGLRLPVYDRQGHGGSSPLDLPRDPDYLRHEAETVLPGCGHAPDL